MIQIPHDTKHVPGTWKGLRGPGGQQALLTCPECKRPVVVSAERHTIAEDGAVSPSMVCPWAGCTFHEFIRLVGWEKGIR